MNDTDKLMPEKLYYEELAYIQSSDDVKDLDAYRELGLEGDLLGVAEAYEMGNQADPTKSHASALLSAYSRIVAENNNHVVVYDHVEQSYSMMRKRTESELRKAIDYYPEYDSYPKEIQALAREMVAEKFSGIKGTPAFVLPNDDVVYFQYNKGTNKIEVGHVTNAGLHPQYDVQYDHSYSLDQNLEALYEELSSWPENQPDISYADEEDIDEDYDSCLHR